MHTRTVLLIALANLLAACASPDTRMESGSMIVVPIEAARFVPANPASPNGAQVAILSGDPDSGPSTMLMRLKKGGGTPHIHSSDYQLVVLQGTMKHLGKGELAANGRPLDPGSYWLQPGGQTHADVCLTEECLMFIVWAGKRDGRLATEGDLR